jgi:GR25 family glycosyltransferase involved in LPS biosynthesis
MNNSFDFFDKIYCINLDERTDRWEHAQEQFKSINILDKVERFSAIKDTDGRIGIIKSNLKILKISKYKNFKNLLIFEDDIQFINNPIENLTLALEQLKTLNFSLFYLGANTHIPLKKISDNLYLLKNAYAAHAICYNNIIFNQAIRQFDNTNKITKHDDILDVWLAKVQDKYNCYVVNPIIATQMPSFSNIENKFVNYDFIEERAKNNLK